MRHVAELRRHRADTLRPEHGQFTMRRTNQPGNNPQQRALARAVLAEHEIQLPWHKLGGDIAHCGEAPVKASNALERDNRLCIVSGGGQSQQYCSRPRSATCS
jgi:ABC-type hemin transport system ATPase subunit